MFEETTKVYVGYDSTYKVYVAGGWFNCEMLKAVKEIEDFVDRWFNLPFKPRTQNLGVAGSDWNYIFKQNVEHLSNADLVIASTVDKDMGTIWECGYAFAKGIPIVYYTPGIDKVNLMLSKSGKIAKTTGDLFKILIEGKEIGDNHEIE